MMSRTLVALALVCLASPLAAQTKQEQWTRCKGFDPDLAIGACTALIQAGTENDFNLSVAYANRGNAYKRRNDFERALKDYAVALKLDPVDAITYYNRGLLYLARNDNAAALSDADRALQVKPGYSVPHGLRAEVLRRRGSFVEAARAFDKALSSPIEFIAVEQWTRDQRAANERAMRCGDANTEVSIGACTAIVRDTTMTREAIGAAFHWRGFAHFNNGNDSQAINDYSEAIRLGIASSFVFLNRGIANVWAARYEEAAQDFERSLSVDPGSAAATNGQGLLARQQGDYPRALERFTAALDLGPRPVTASTAAYVMNRGMTYLLMERYDLALIDLNSALSVAPRDAVFVVCARCGEAPDG